MPKGMFKKEGTQLRPGLVTKTSDPKDPPQPGGSEGRAPC